MHDSAPPLTKTSLLIGLTGGIGSGKSTVAEGFKTLGANYIDADIVAREVVALGTPCLASIAAQFGPTILQQDGTLNRAALRQIIFQDNTAKEWLEALLHPAIRQALLQQLAASQTPYTLLVAPLLFENGLDKLVQRTVVVDVAEETQLARATKRDSSSQSQIKAIMDAQMTRFQRRQRADEIIDNNGDATQLFAQIKVLHDKFLELAAKLAH
ncbi:dephospho-CoA kinase [Alishewanella tabrizica]|uniref:Dephospho-CoA kinase n=1 Tax=Alishewanella tabrizica TaxID=671278 RepID=A0ABQ2WIC1_9ALTE|nr:dephospho-CoA kinase [Alishewanella tabrizica]GGW55371.1 dephospho-CoA kinase [Alishewanella tabrizica]